MIYRNATLLLLSSLMLVSCNSFNSTAPTPAANTDAGLATSHILSGVASLGLPLAHAQIQVSSFSGVELLKTTAYNTGAFDIVTAARPRNFVVTATGTLEGEPVTLSAELLDNNGGRIRISAISTLVSTYHRQHPGQSRAQVERTVKTLLSLPHGLNLNRGIAKSLFDPQVFLTQARQSGGVNTYINWLVAQADSGKHYSFRSLNEGLQAQAVGRSSLSTTGSTVGTILAGLSEGLHIGDTAGLGIILGSVAEALGGAGSENATDAKLEEISTQLNTVENRLEVIDSELNTLQGNLAADTTKIDSDVNYQAYNTVYNQQLSTFVENTNWVVGNLSSIIDTARSEHPDLVALQTQIDEVKAFITEHFNVTAADHGTLQMDAWKDQLISNGFATNGVLQLWSHYIASRSPIYNAQSAQAVQDQWDFIDAQWLLYAMVQMEGLNMQTPGGNHLSLLQTWANDRRAVVGKLLGGTKDMAALNAGLSTDAPGYQVINSVLAQSQPTPFPTNALYVQADNSLWWLKMANNEELDANLKPLGGLFGLTSDVFQAASSQAISNAVQQMGPGAWIVPGTSSYTNLQAALKQLGEEFKDEQFDNVSPSGSNQLIIPLSSIDLLSTHDGLLNHNSVYDKTIYAYDPSETLRSLPYQSHDASEQAEQGCPTTDTTWNSSDNLGLHDNMYRLYSGTTSYTNLFGGYWQWSVAFSAQNGDYAGCSAMQYPMLSSTLFVNRSLNKGENYWY